MTFNLKTKHTIEEILKILSIISFTALFISSLAVLKIPPSNGYEISIYRAFPMFFWVCVFTTIFSSIIVMIYSAVFSNKYWVLGLLSLLTCYILIYSLPTIRGYAFFSRTGGDFYFHIYNINLILASGHLAKNLFYPLTHILVTIINLIGNLPVRESTTLNCISFFFFYILSFFLLGKVILNTNIGATFMLILSSPMIYSAVQYAFYPFFFALCFLPMLIYCVTQKTINNRWEFSVLLLILIFCITLYHPIVSIMIIIFLAILVIHQSLSFGLPRVQKFLFNEISFTLIAFEFWYFNFRVFLSKIQTIINALFYSEKATPIAEYQTSCITSSDASIWLILERFVKIYGVISLYFITAIILVIFVFSKIRSHKRKKIEVIYSFQFLIALIFGFLQIFCYFIIDEPIRALSYPIVISIIICSIVFHEIYQTTKSVAMKKLIINSIILITCLSCFLGTYNLYPSPWEGVLNPQMSHQDMNGYNWFLEKNNNSVPLYKLYDPLYKYSLFAANSDSYKFKIVENVSIPSHFGYQIYSTISNNFDHSKSYMIMTEYARNAYLAVSENRKSFIPIFLEEDFVKLNKDHAVNKIYINGEFYMWQII